MEKNRHIFSEEYEELLGFGYSRETDAATLTYYLQRFSQDELMALIRQRISQEHIDELAALLMRLMKTYLTDDEYHRHFLRDGEEAENQSPKTLR